MKILQIIVFAYIVTSCSTPKDPIKDSSWLQGTWNREFNGNTQIESWKLHNDSLVGTNSFANGRDTTLMMNYSIFKSNENWILITRDNGVEFDERYELVYINSDSIKFRNSSNGWPENITYKKLDNNQMEQNLHGLFQGYEKSISFKFTMD